MTLRASVGSLCSEIQAYLSGLLLMRLSDEAYRNPVLSFHPKKWSLIWASFSINILSLALPIMTLQVYDRLLVSYNIATLGVLTSGVVVVVVLEGFLRLARAYVIGWAGAVYEHTIACNALRHILAADLMDVQTAGTVTQLQRMNNIARLREFFSGQALVAMVDVPFVLMFFILVAWLGGWLVCVPLVIIAIFIVLSVDIGRKLRATIIARDNVDEERLGHIIESLEGIHTIKAMGLEDFFLRRYEAYQNKSSNISYRFAKFNGRLSSYGIIFTQLMTVAVIAVGALIALEGKITLGALIACVLLCARIMQPLQRVMRLWAGYQNFKVATDNIEEIFSIPKISRCASDELGARRGQLEIKNLFFAYPDSNQVLLRDINLTLHPGQSISISGAHGCGKTTLLKLITGLYRPAGGEVFVDGIPVRKYPARELVYHVGFLPMNTVIFRGSIQDNLSAFGEHSHHQVESIVKLLELDKDIKKLPAGYKTMLDGTEADAIPPGVCQRIAIACALATHPRIILFDNADRALDNEGYHQVYRLLARLKGNATMIIISDDQNMARLADASYVLRDGVLQAQTYSKDVTGYDIKPYQELRL